MTANELSRSLTHARQHLEQALAVADGCDETLLGALVASCLDELAKRADATNPQVSAARSRPGDLIGRGDQSSVVKSDLPNEGGEDEAWSDHGGDDDGLHEEQKPPRN